MITLRRLDPAGSVVAPADRTLMVLTGLSSLVSADLSDTQRRFLRDVVPAGVQAVDANFPYHPGMLTGSAVTAPLWRASLRNTAQGLAAWVVPGFPRLVARHLQPAFDRTRTHLGIITGSCGLMLLARASRWLRVPPKLRLSVIALGPVGPGPSGRLRAYTVRGSHDWISRCLSTGRADAHVPAGHLDYCVDPEVLALVTRQCERFFDAS